MLKKTHCWQTETRVTKVELVLVAYGYNIILFTFLLVIGFLYVLLQGISTDSCETPQFLVCFIWLF